MERLIRFECQISVCEHDLSGPSLPSEQGTTARGQLLEAEGFSPCSPSAPEIKAANPVPRRPFLERVSSTAACGAKAGANSSEDPFPAARRCRESSGEAPKCQRGEWPSAEPSVQTTVRVPSLVKPFSEKQPPKRHPAPQLKIRIESALSGPNKVSATPVRCCKSSWRGKRNVQKACSILSPNSEGKGKPCG